MKQYVYITSFLFLMMTASCGNKKKCDGQPGLSYIFELPVKIFPAKDTFIVGDTIWIENSFSNNLFNIDNGKIYNVDNYDFKTKMYIIDLSTNYSYSYINPKLIDVNGITENSTPVNIMHQTLNIRYAYKDNMYLYKTMFIVEKSGFYMFQFASDVYMKSVDFTECPDEEIRPRYATNNKGDNNYEWIRLSKDVYYNQYDKERFDNEGCYCFYVK